MFHSNPPKLLRNSEILRLLQCVLAPLWTEAQECVVPAETSFLGSDQQVIQECAMVVQVEIGQEEIITSLPTTFPTFSPSVSLTRSPTSPAPILMTTGSPSMAAAPTVPAPPEPTIADHIFSFLTKASTTMPTIAMMPASSLTTPARLSPIGPSTPSPVATPAPITSPTTTLPTLSPSVPLRRSPTTGLPAVTELSTPTVAPPSAPTKSTIPDNAFLFLTQLPTANQEPSTTTKMPTISRMPTSPLTMPATLAPFSPIEQSMMAPIKTRRSISVPSAAPDDFIKPGNIVGITIFLAVF